VTRRPSCCGPTTFRRQRPRRALDRPVDRYALHDDVFADEWRIDSLLARFDPFVETHGSTGDASGLNRKLLGHNRDDENVPLA
jgi:hypothetical protein